MNSNIAYELLLIENHLTDALNEIRIPSEKVSHIYNPLVYAQETHANYVNQYLDGTKNILFLGMNPGPFGMAQNGVPFGNTSHVKEWLNISGNINHPDLEHPKKTIFGLDCQRREISGERFWGFIKSVCGNPVHFFRNCFVYNYCPLLFLSETGRNIASSNLPVAIRRQIENACDVALLNVINTVKCDTIVAVGKYAEEKAKHVISTSGLSHMKVVRILHPSPASPQANQGWEPIVRQQLTDQGIIQFLSPTSLV